MRGGMQAKFRGGTLTWIWFMFSFFLVEIFGRSNISHGHLTSCGFEVWLPSECCFWALMMPEVRKLGCLLAFPSWQISSSSAWEEPALLSLAFWSCSGPNQIAGMLTQPSFASVSLLQLAMDTVWKSHFGQLDKSPLWLPSSPLCILLLGWN